MEYIIYLFVGGIISYVIGYITCDFIWKSRLDDNNIKFKGFDKEGYSVLKKSFKSR